jgi:hypothetical protein
MNENGLGLIEILGAVLLVLLILFLAGKVL